MHQVAELVKECDHIVIAHQAWIAGRAAWKITDERALGQVLSRNAREDGVHAEPLVLARTRMHVEIEAAGKPVAVINLPRRDGRVPDRRMRRGLEPNVKEFGCR